jgi:hypothetical protein
VKTLNHSRLAVLGLFGVGSLALVVGLVMFFGGFMKDRKSDPDLMQALDGGLGLCFT